MCWKVEEKGFFCSLASVGVGFRGIVCDLTPNSDGLVRKVWQDDNPAPFSSDKIRAKSARILSAAITRTILLPAGVRGSHDGFHSGVG